MVAAGVLSHGGLLAGPRGSAIELPRPPDSARRRPPAASEPVAARLG